MSSDFLHKLAAELAGTPIPGGCDRCDAEQVLTEEPPGVFVLVVQHDDWCPVLVAKQMPHQTGCTDRTIRQGDVPFDRGSIRFRCLGCGSQTIVRRPVTK